LRLVQNLLWFVFAWAFIALGIAPSLWLLARGLTLLETVALLPVAVTAGVSALLLVAWVVFAVALPKPRSGVHPVASLDGARWTLYSGVANFYLKVFQPLLFLNDVTRFLVLRALHCQVTLTTWITSRVHLGDPRHIRVGPRSVIGDHAMLVPAYMPKAGKVVIGDIDIGADTLVAGMVAIGPDVRIGDRCVLQIKVDVAPRATIGNDCKIGGASRIDVDAVIGDDVHIGRDCRIGRGAHVPSGSRLPDGSIVP
jgi:acetyltransferase-like isoleucine patch superfamily enzyme